MSNFKEATLEEIADTIAKRLEPELRHMYNKGLWRAIGIVNRNKTATPEHLLKLIENELLEIL